MYNKQNIYIIYLFKKALPNGSITDIISGVGWVWSTTLMSHIDIYESIAFMRTISFNEDDVHSTHVDTFKVLVCIYTYSTAVFTLGLAETQK